MHELAPGCRAPIRGCTIEGLAPEAAVPAREPAMPKLSQETFAIVGASIGLAALILTSTAQIRGEIRDIRAEMRDIRAEARADRETFERHIIRLTEQQGILMGHVENINNQLATTR